MPTAPDPITRVQRAISAKRRAEEQYRAALVGAVADLQKAGARDAYAQVAAAAGISRQGVRQVVERAHKAAGTSADEQRLRARLDELDARWDRFIDELAGVFAHPDAKREQLQRNQANGKAKRIHARAVKAQRSHGMPVSSTGPTLRLTVRAESRRFAETYALRYLDEAAALREALMAIVDARVPFLHD